MKLKKYFPLLLILALGCGQDVADEESPVLDDNNAQDEPVDISPDTPDVQSGELEFRPENFVSDFDNPYFSVKPGRKIFFDGRTHEGVEIHRELVGTDITRDVLGVTATAIWEREWQNDQLVEDTKSWYAQDDEGNVWLLAQDEQKLFGSLLLAEEGNSWEAGVDGAKAGIVFPATPEVGEKFTREYDGSIQETSEIVSTSEEIKAPGGTFSDCVQVKDIVPGQGEVTSAEEHTIYCAEVGNMSTEFTPNSFGKITLTRIEDNFSVTNINPKYTEFAFKIDVDKALEIANDEIEDADFAKSHGFELLDGDPVYKIEVVKDNGNSEWVWVDRNTGKVLKTS